MTDTQPRTRTRRQYTVHFIYQRTHGGCIDLWASSHQNAADKAYRLFAEWEANGNGKSAADYTVIDTEIKSP